MSDSESEPADDHDEEPTDQQDSELGNSLDVGFDESEPGEGLDEPEAPTEHSPSNTLDETRTSTETGSPTTTTETTKSTRDTQAKADIPHRVRAESPKENRDPINLFVGEEEKQRLQELQQLADREFDENVYKIDVYLAALRIDIEDSRRFLAAMEDIGYGYFE